MATDPFEPIVTFRPQIAGKRSERDPHRVPLLGASMRQRLERHRRSSKATVGKPRGTAGVREPKALSRRCLVKSHFVPMKAGARDAARLHLTYLERDGVERDGSAGVLYGAGAEFDREAIAAEIAGERRQFRFIVSPEDAGELDLHDFTRQLMARVEKDLGRRLIWAAVNHHNTEHPHVHVVVRGVDADGRDLRIPGGYIKQEMRWRAQEIATRELGLRSEFDFARQRTNEVGQERLTSLDTKLRDLAGEGGVVTGKSLAGLSPSLRPTLIARLQVLRKLGLVRPLPRGAWELGVGWDQRLRELGERGDIIKRLHRVAPGDVSRYRFPEPGELAGPIEGVVRGKGLHDELTGELFAAVETQSGEAHYVRLDPEAADLLKVGDVVRVAQITEPWVKATDKVVAQIAQLHGGVYDPTKHLAQLEALGRKQGSPSPADLIAGNVRRLERLERYGLVQRSASGAWTIPPDLVQQLEARERSHPRHRLRVQYLGADLRTQATYPGPTWLDRQALAAAERAPWGFGLELGKAIQERIAFLRARGIEPGGPEQARDLEATERTLLARRFAQDLGLRHLEQVAGLRGTLTTCPILPSGRSYVRVVDERARRFVLIPATAETRRLAGREVDVSVEPGGRVSVAPARRLDRGDPT